MFKRNDSGKKILEEYKDLFTGNVLEEVKYREQLMDISTKVEFDKNFDQNKKLYIYDAIKYLENCKKQDRKKYMKKLERLLK